MRTRFLRPFDSVAQHTLAPRARDMRVAATESEALLWAHLRRGQLGVRFRRQVILGPFIVDFLAPSVRLVVEVDGGVHFAQQDADMLRDEALTALGYRVVRVSVDDVVTRVDAVLQLLRGHLG
jgi:very-short-patch-repair endonuclease